MIVTSRRAVAAGAAAAAALALAAALHGLIFAVLAWFAHPWRLAVLTAAALALAAIWHGTLTRHSDRGIRIPRREREQRREDARESAARAQAEWEAFMAPRQRLALAAAPVMEHSATWETRTDVVDYGDLPAFTPDLSHDGAPEPLPPAPLVTVTDSPGRHAQPRAHPFRPGPEPYCGQCGQAGHWRGDPGCAGDAVVTELITRRREDHVAGAIAGHLADAGFAAHVTADEMLDSVVGHVFPELTS